MRAYPVRNDNRQIVAVIVMVMDVTSRVEGLRHQKEYTAYLSEKLSFPIDDSPGGATELGNFP